MSTTLSDHLMDALSRAGKTKIELARACGVSHPSVSNWCNGRTKVLAADNALKAAHFLGVSVTWLTTGTGARDPAAVASFKEDDVPSGYVSIPEYRITCGAGADYPPTYEEVTEEESVCYRDDWFKKHGVSPENCRRFRVHGDSMIPILFDGDRILVDCRKGQSIVSGKIYVFVFDGFVRVKRLYTKIAGGLVVRSENPAESDEEVPAMDMDRFYLVGRVIDRSGSAPL